jgi:Mg/Co/Ni transporter MgtE
MIFKFKQFIKESLNLDEQTLKTIKGNLKYILKEYKEYMLSNIKIENEKVVYKDFDNIEYNVIMRELNNEFTKEVIKELKTEELISKIKKLYSDREITIKKEIRKAFNEYFNHLENFQK